MALADRLKEETTEQHKRAERAPAWGVIFSGQMTKEQYGDYLGQLYGIYQALEVALEANRGTFEVDAVDFPEIYRTPSYEADLEWAYGPDWADRITFTQGTQDYISRIEELSRDSPELLGAHAYTRYLADMFGGQMIKRVVKQTFGTDEGASHLVFDRVENLRSAIDDFKAGINSLPAELGDAFVDEVKRAYDLTYDVLSNE